MFVRGLLVILLLMTLFIQEQVGHEHTPQSDGQVISFEPVTSGNIIPIGNFQALIPEGVVYALEEDVPLMVGLLGAVEIPNCVGILYSDSNSFKYGVAIQHFSGVSFNPIEPLAPDFFINVFSQRHLLTLAPFTGQVEPFISPQFSNDLKSMMLGFQYSGNKDNLRHDGVFIKKIILSKNEALVATVRVSDPEQYEIYRDEITAILDNLSRVQEGEDFSGPSISAYDLLGLTIDMNSNRAELGLPVILGSLGLAVLGIGLLVFAVKLSRKNRGDSLEPEE